MAHHRDDLEVRVSPKYAADSFSNARMRFPQTLLARGPLAPALEQLLVRGPRQLTVGPLLRSIRYPLVQVEFDVHRAAQPPGHDHRGLQRTRHRRGHDRVDTAEVGEVMREILGLADTD